MAEIKTMWERISDHLIENGVDVYAPATHKGECRKEYVVLKDDGASKYGTFSTAVHYYSVLCYVPRDRRTDLERLVNKCKEIMNNMSPMIMPTGLETPEFYDDSIKAHMISIQYRNYVRNRLL